VSLLADPTSVGEDIGLRIDRRLR